MPSLFNFKKNHRNISVSKYKQIKNKILLFRNIGGYGDILAMRMIFEDLRKQYPDFLFDWAVPHGYFAAAKHHPFVNNILYCGDYDEDEYLAAYNLSHSCQKYEWSKGKFNDKNRADIWANGIGATLNNHNMWLPSYHQHKEKILTDLKNIGWDGRKKLVLFAPRSAMSVKNLTVDQCAHIKKMTEDYFLFILHTVPIIEISHLKIPIIFNYKLDECMACTEIVDFVIATDTGHMHCAAGYKKPTLAIFCYTDGRIIAKYYDTVKVVQNHYLDDPDYCGPCNNYGTCTRDEQAKIKPCLTDVTNEMIYEGWNFITTTNK